MGNLYALERKLLEELRNGRESAFQLQTLVRDSVEAQLARKILRSFTEGLSMMSSLDADSAQIAVGGGDGGGPVSAAGRKEKSGVRDRRGCYKRT
ncbi:putative WRKY transcription factor 70 [Dorcoceras hygrometricum]|nr:putative WRKY transcription factor 70 [Dorcoceras hygrometricum]